MGTEKVAYQSLVSATVKMSNSVDTQKVYDIEADVNMSGNTVSGFNSGFVKKGGVQVATFNSYGNTNLNVNHNVEDAEGRCAVTAAISAFIEDVKSKVSVSQPLSI